MTIGEGVYTLSWEQGRQLAGISYTAPDNEGNYELIFRYNSDGLRTHKEYINDYDGTYYYMESEYDGSTLIREAHYKGAPSDWTLYRNVYYLYDENGSPFGMRVVDSLQNSYYYFYEKNLQGDIVAVLNEEGYTLASYTYDAWGNILSTTYATVSTGITSTDIAHSKLNPFRYRGYYYDQETGWYYLQTRYYNPAWGRFINADAYIAGGGGAIFGYNQFSYCLNNPVNMLDDSGNWPSWNDVQTFLKEAVDAYVHITSIALCPLVTLSLVTLHYNRNIFNNDDVSEAELLKDDYEPELEEDSKFHQNHQKNGKENRKYVIGAVISMMTGIT